MQRDSMTAAEPATVASKPLPRLLAAILVFVIFSGIAFGIHRAGLHSPMIYDSKGIIADSEHIFATLDPVKVMGIVSGRPVFMLSLYANYRLSGMDPFWFRVCNVLLSAGAGLALAWLVLVILEIPHLSRGREPQPTISSAPVGPDMVRLRAETVPACPEASGTVPGVEHVNGSRPPVASPIKGGEAQPRSPSRRAESEGVHVCLKAGSDFEKRDRNAEDELSNGSVISRDQSRVLRGGERIGTLWWGRVGDTHAVSLAMGLLFVAHPLQTFVVLYVWQRSAVMACLCFFLSLGLYLGARAGRFRHPAGAYAAAGALFLAAMLSKENAASLPLVLFIAEITLLGRRFRPAVKRIPLIMLVTVPPLLLYVWCVHALHAPGSGTPPAVIDRMLEYYGMSGQTPLQVLLTQCRIFLEYLRMVVAPFAGGVDLVRAETVATSLWEPPGTLMGCAGMLAMIAAGLVLIRRAPVVSFGLLFFVAALLPESVFMPKYIYFGYRPILSAAGLLLILGWGATRVLRDAGLSLRMGAAAALVLAVGVLAAQTAGQARKWNPIAFWTAAYEKLPVYAPAVEKVAYLDILVNFTGLLNRQGTHVQSADVLRKVVPEASAVGIDEGTDRLAQVFGGFPPRVAKTLVNLGNGLRKSGDLDGAARLYRKAANIDPELAQAYANLGMVLDQQGEHETAMEQFRRAVRTNPNFPDAHFLIGNALLRSGDTTQAVSSYQEALRLRPGFSVAQANLGIACIRQGRFSEAVPHLQKAASAMPLDADVHHSLGVALANTGNIPDAIRHFRKALDIRPDHPGARNSLDVLDGMRR
ncbi:MAG: tetratricopeptide repeat protein [Thermodesulfobacteriota bacterium]